MSDGTTRQRVSPISELFRADRVALWATTYTFDLDLFSGYLFGRLGEPPLNVVVMADRDRLDAALDALPPERVNRLDSVNRRWLLRGARLGRGRFHPKSYLAVTGRSAKLLVGSGNLSMSGLDAGREVFTAFVAGTPDGDAAIATWMDWMRRVVNELDDTILAERFSDLEARMTLAGPSGAVESSLWHNLDRSLADQFCERVLLELGQVDELIVTAPFFDEAGEALGHLLTRMAPKHVTIYTAATTKVNGTKLAARLAGIDAVVKVFAYVPEAFTHAKLLGAVAGDRGWLLSGSANLSNAALTLPADLGNVELAVGVALSADELRNVFLPPECEAEEQSLAVLATLTFGIELDGASPYRVRITRATSMPDGRVEIIADPPPDNTLRLADHKDVQSLTFEKARIVTNGALTGPLVCLVDERNETVSNLAIVDDVEALRRALQAGEPESSTSSRPHELVPNDLDTPLGQVLVKLHRMAVMDVSEIAGSGGASEATRSEAGHIDADDDLWDRLAREQLGRDPRTSIYERFTASTARAEPGDPVIELLDAMRDRIPDNGAGHEPLQRKVSVSGSPDTPPTRSKWSTSARIRVRARNVLRRWASAQMDPRLTWVDPFAPLGNLSLVAATFAQLWRYLAEPGVDAGLTEADLDSLWLEWISGFVGTGRADGWLHRCRLPDNELRSRLGGNLARNVTALCWLAIRPGLARRRRVVEWQSVLWAILDLDLFEVEEDTAEYLKATGYSVSAARVESDIYEALGFIDDDLWCVQKAEEMALPQLELEEARTGRGSSPLLHVDDIDDPLTDPRIPALTAALFQYKRIGRVLIRGKESDWRLSISVGEPIHFMSGRHAEGAESVPLISGAIEKLAARGGVLADLFPAAARGSHQQDRS